MLWVGVHSLRIGRKVTKVLILVLNVHEMMLLFGTDEGDLFLLLKLLLSRRNNLFQRQVSTASDLDSVLLILNSVLTWKLFYKIMVGFIFKGAQFVFQFSGLCR